MKKIIKTTAILLALILCTCCSQTAAPAATEKPTEKASSEKASEKQPEPDSDISTDSDPADISSVITDDTEVQKNDTVTIYDEMNKKLGEIHLKGVATVTEAGIFYPALPEKGDPSITEYHLYDPDTGKDRVIGEMKDVAYEATYARCEMDGCIYLLVMTGNIMDNDPDPLVLVKADLTNQTLTPYPIDNGMSPYAVMTPAKDKIVMAWHDQQEILTDRVLEFDPAAETMKEIMTYTLDQQEIGESIRGLCSDGEKLYQLRILFEKAGKKLLLDTFDLSYQKLSETDITSIVNEAASELQGGEDASIELQMPVSHFLVREGCFYYENFSMTRCIANIETGKLLLAANDLFNASIGSGRTFFYTIIKNGSDDENAPDVIYDLNWDELRAQEFTAFDPAYYLVNGSSAPDGTRLLVMEKREGTERYTILYYLKLHPEDAV